MNNIMTEINANSLPIKVASIIVKYDKLPKNNTKHRISKISIPIVEKNFLATLFKYPFFICII